MPTVVDVAEVKLGNLTFYGVFTGWGNLCVCDAWILEESDVEMLIGKEDYRRLWDAHTSGTIGEFCGVFLTRDRKKAEQVAQLIRERRPEGFCLGCLRNEHRRRVNHADGD